MHCLCLDNFKISTKENLFHSFWTFSESSLYSSRHLSEAVWLVKQMLYVSDSYIWYCQSYCQIFLHVCLDLLNDIIYSRYTNTFESNFNCYQIWSWRNDKLYHHNYIFAPTWSCASMVVCSSSFFEILPKDNICSHRSNIQKSKKFSFTCDVHIWSIHQVIALNVFVEDKSSLLLLLYVHDFCLLCFRTADDILKIMIG